MSNILRIFKKINYYELSRLAIFGIDLLIIQFTDIEKLEKSLLISLILINFCLIVLVVCKLPLTKTTKYQYSAQSAFYGSIASGIFAIIIFGSYLLK